MCAKFGCNNFFEIWIRTKISSVKFQSQWKSISNMHPRNSFHKVFMSSWSKSHKDKCCFYLKNNHLIRSQFCTCHDSSAVMTCANVWPDWIIRITITVKIFFRRFRIWTHVLFVRWVLGPNVLEALYCTSAYKWVPDVCTRQNTEGF